MEYVYEAVAYGLLFQDSERSMMSCLFLGLMKFSYPFLNGRDVRNMRTVFGFMHPLKL